MRRHTNRRGLRAIKSVLVVAGSLLRAEEGQQESNVLFRALRDLNIAKILAQDMVVFMGLLKDLFPGLDPPRELQQEGVCARQAQKTRSLHCSWPLVVPTHPHPSRLCSCLAHRQARPAV